MHRQARRGTRAWIAVTSAANGVIVAGLLLLAANPSVAQPAEGVRLLPVEVTSPWYRVEGNQGRGGWLWSFGYPQPIEGFVAYRDPNTQENGRPAAQAELDAAVQARTVLVWTAAQVRSALDERVTALQGEVRELRREVRDEVKAALNSVDARLFGNEERAALEERIAARIAAALEQQVSAVRLELRREIGETYEARIAALEAQLSQRR
jgi:hypothetical protein